MAAIERMAAIEIWETFVGQHPLEFLSNSQKIFGMAAVVVDDAIGLYIDRLPDIFPEYQMSEHEMAIIEHAMNDVTMQVLEESIQEYE